MTASVRGPGGNSAYTVDAFVGDPDSVRIATSAGHSSIRAVDPTTGTQSRSSAGSDVIAIGSAVYLPCPGGFVLMTTTVAAPVEHDPRELLQMLAKARWTDHDDDTFRVLSPENRTVAGWPILGTEIKGTGTVGGASLSIALIPTQGAKSTTEVEAEFVADETIRVDASPDDECDQL